MFNQYFLLDSTIFFVVYVELKANLCIVLLSSLIFSCIYEGDKWGIWRRHNKLMVPPKMRICGCLDFIGLPIPLKPIIWWVLTRLYIITINGRYYSTELCICQNNFIPVYTLYLLHCICFKNLFSKLVIRWMPFEILFS